MTVCVVVNYMYTAHVHEDYVINLISTTAKKQHNDLLQMLLKNCLLITSENNPLYHIHVHILRLHTIYM